MNYVTAVAEENHKSLDFTDRFRIPLNGKEEF